MPSRPSEVGCGACDATFRRYRQRVELHWAIDGETKERRTNANCVNDPDGAARAAKGRCVTTQPRFVHHPSRRIGHRLAPLHHRKARRTKPRPFTLVFDAAPALASAAASRPRRRPRASPRPILLEQLPTAPVLPLSLTRHPRASTRRTSLNETPRPCTFHTTSPPRLSPPQGVSNCAHHRGLA